MKNTLKKNKAVNSVNSMENIERKFLSPFKKMENKTLNENENCDYDLENTSEFVDDNSNDNDKKNDNRNCDIKKNIGPFGMPKLNLKK